MAERDYQIILLAEPGGGVARHVIDIYGMLKERGRNVKMVLSSTRMEEMFLEELAETAPGDLLMLPMKRSVSASDVAILRRIRQFMGQSKFPCLLHAHSTKAGFLGMFLGSTSHARVYTPHAYRSVDPHLGSVDRFLIQSAEKRISRSYNLIFGIVEAEVEHARSLGIPAERLRLIPNGIRLSRFPSAPRRFEGEARIGFLGRLVPQKDPLLFVRVFHRINMQMPGCKAIVFGSGPLEEEMRELAAELGISSSMSWRGTVPAPQALAEFDVMVHTSRYEGMPYTLIESAAAGVPVVAVYNHGSYAIMNRLLPEFVFPASAIDEMAAAVVKIWRDKSELQRVRDSLDALANTFTLEKMVDNLEREYDTAFSETLGAGRSFLNRRFDAGKASRS